MATLKTTKLLAPLIAFLAPALMVTWYFYHHRYFPPHYDDGAYWLITIKLAQSLESDPLFTFINKIYFLRDMRPISFPILGIPFYFLFNQDLHLATAFLMGAQLAALSLLVFSFFKKAGAPPGRSCAYAYFLSMIPSVFLSTQSYLSELSALYFLFQGLYFLYPSPKAASNYKTMAAGLLIGLALTIRPAHTIAFLVLASIGFYPLLGTLLKWRLILSLFLVFLFWYWPYFYILRDWILGTFFADRPNHVILLPSTAIIEKITNLTAFLQKIYFLPWSLLPLLALLWKRKNGLVFWTPLISLGLGSILLANLSSDEDEIVNSRHHLLFIFFVFGSVAYQLEKRFKSNALFFFLVPSILFFMWKNTNKQNIYLGNDFLRCSIFLDPLTRALPPNIPYKVAVIFENHPNNIVELPCQVTALKMKILWEFSIDFSDDYILTKIEHGELDYIVSQAREIDPYGGFAKPISKVFLNANGTSKIFNIYKVKKPLSPNFSN